MAILLFYTGSTDRAIQEVTAVLELDPSHIQANLNLGVFYWQGRGDYENAARQITTAIDLADAGTEPHDAVIASDARAAMQQLKADAEKAGITLDIDPKYLPQETT